MTEVLEALVERIEADRPNSGRQLIGIDGIGASGKTTFAIALAARITSRPVVLLHLDDFFHAPEVRHARGRYSPEGFWLDTYDYDALTTGALDPLSSGRSVYRSSTVAEQSEVSADAVVLVEGVFLQRERLTGYWDASVYLHVPFAVAAARMASRGTVADGVGDPLLERYFGAQRIYFEQCSPWERASLVVDNSDWSRPRIIDGLQGPTS